jgi:hypothetical protein
LVNLPPSRPGRDHDRLPENVAIAAPSTGTSFPTWGWGVNNSTMLFTVQVFDQIFPAFNPWLLLNNITCYLERLGKAVTNVIRSASSNEFVHGQAFDNEVYVNVRWWWLSLPIELLLVSYVFVLATVVKGATEKDQVSIRKNSAIAT